MIVDTSALVAILAREPERQRYIDLILAATECSISAPTLLETSIVLRKFSSEVLAALYEFLREAQITILSFDKAQSAVADDAYRRFGRGSGHAAGLNFGDCFAYAASMSTDRPLLFKGNDFALTDVRSALK